MTRNKTRILNNINHVDIFTITYQTIFRINFIWAASWENRLYAYAKTKLKISCAANKRLWFSFINATICLPPKAYSHLHWLHSLVCVGPVRKPQRQVFSGCNSFFFLFFLLWRLFCKLWYQHLIFVVSSTLSPTAHVWTINGKIIY